MSSLKKKCQVVMLPTEEKAILHLSIGGKLTDNHHTRHGSGKGDNSWKPQHLYILSDDKIKEGDWFINLSFIDKTLDNKPYQADKNDVNISLINEKKYCKKVIATTDNSLALNPTHYTDGTKRAFHTIEYLPQPSFQFISKFIEEYNKGTVITDVLVEYETKCIGCGAYVNKDMKYCSYPAPDEHNRCLHNVLKVNPKDNTITITKLKDSWSREEVVGLINRAFLAGYERSHSGYPNTDNHTKPTVEQWILNNL